MWFSYFFRVKKKLAETTSRKPSSSSTSTVPLPRQTAKGTRLGIGRSHPSW